MRSGPAIEAEWYVLSLTPTQNVNTVDVIYPSWPLFVYTNATLGKQLLLPLFEYQATGQYPNQFSVHDMGLFLSLREFMKRS